jgi:hypothetical protein
VCIVHCVLYEMKVLNEVEQPQLCEGRVVSFCRIVVFAVGVCVGGGMSSTNERVV